MNDALKMNTAEDFRLLSYLAADLRIARVLLHGATDGGRGPQLWLGMVSPRFVPLLPCRIAHCFDRLKLGHIAKAVSLLNSVLFGIEIAVRCVISKGLFFPHTPGTVIGTWSVGMNATIFQGVTLGAKELDFSYQESSRLTVGDGVTIGAVAKVLGSLFIGNGARIGANSVVLQSIPAQALAVGAPARVVQRRQGEPS